MSLESLLREAITSGKLHEPFSAGEATSAVGLDDWPLKRVHSFLVRHCHGNLAAIQIYFDRVSFGRYRLLGIDATTRRRPAPSMRRGWTRREPTPRQTPVNGRET